MQEIYKSDILEVIIDENGIINAYFTSEDYVEEELIKQELMKLGEIVEEHKPEKLLVCTQKLKFPFLEQIIKWILENVTPKFLNAGVKKIAYVMPKDLITKFGVEELVEALLINVQGIKRMFFEDLEEAKKWIVKE